MEKTTDRFENDVFAKNCGIEIVEITDGFSKCKMLVSESHLNGIGIVMGGAIFTLGDFAFSIAANSKDNVAVTLNAFISFLKPCRSGTITAIAKEVSRTKKIAVYQVRIENEKNEAIAELSGTAFFK